MKGRKGCKSGGSPGLVAGNPKVAAEAREGRKSGGVVHREKMGEMKHAKHVGHVHGERTVGRMDRKPRKNGGRTGADSSPFSSARHGTNPPGHKAECMD